MPTKKSKPHLSPSTKRWQLQEAKAKFSKVFDLAMTTAPQRVTRHDRDTVLVVRESDFETAVHERQRPTVMEALLAATKLGGLTTPRAQEYPEPAGGFE